MAMSLNEVISSLWSSIKTYLVNNYLNKNGKAASATVADKATADASGNTITSTYQTKLSTAQLAAANSRITSSKVTTYDAYAAAIGTKANSSDLTSHTTNNNIHVTSSDKSNWNNKSNFSGSYTDLTNKPTIPTVNNATLTIQKNGTTVKTFSANASSNVTANITVPTKTSQLSNDSDYATKTNVANSLQEAKNYTGLAVANCVNLTGTQTITGTKSIDSNYINLIDSTWDYTDTTNASHARMYRISDKTGMLLGGLQLSQDTSNNRYLSLLIKDDDGVNSYVNISSGKAMYPSGDNTFSLGLPNRRWANVYATNFTGNLFYGNLFYGNLNGNATSATKATRDASGNVITDTYATKAENSLKANIADAVLKANTEYIFSNYFLNSLNIDEKYNENYVVSISEDGHGTLPIGGWTNIINFSTNHFLTQLCIPIHPNKDTDCMYIRTRWIGDPTWGEWRKSANDNSVVHKSGDETINGVKTFTSETVNTSVHAFRHVFGEYGAFWRHDGINLYLMLTNKNDQYGHWNSYRPIQVNLSTGKCYINGVDPSASNADVVGKTVTAYYTTASLSGRTDRDFSGNETKSFSTKTNTITPTVGTIYSGAQLYAIAVGSGSWGKSGNVSENNIYINQVLNSLLEFTGQYSSSAKYLCTTAQGVYNTSSGSSTLTNYSLAGNQSYGFKATGTLTNGTITNTIGGGKSTFLRVQ